jgi:hypothetical protein
MMTGPLCHAARALAELSRAELASISGVDERAIQRFEDRSDTPAAEDMARLQSALESWGVVFLPEDSRGAGVRLKFTVSERKRLATLETEGGIIRHDDVP